MSDERTRQLGVVSLVQLQPSGLIIENSIILTNCKIVNCVIRNCVIDENSDLSNLDLSYKMIRQGSKIKK